MGYFDLELLLGLTGGKKVLCDELSDTRNSGRICSSKENLGTSIRRWGVVGGWSPTTGVQCGRLSLSVCPSSHSSHILVK